jgi:hypothetical protein
VKEYLPGVPENLWWSSTPFQQFVVQFTLAYVLVDTVFVRHRLPWGLVSLIVVLFVRLAELIRWAVAFRC